MSAYLLNYNKYEKNRKMNFHKIDKRDATTGTKGHSVRKRFPRVFTIYILCTCILNEPYDNSIFLKFHSITVYSISSI